MNATFLDITTRAGIPKPILGSDGLEALPSDLRRELGIYCMLNYNIISNVSWLTLIDRDHWAIS